MKIGYARISTRDQNLDLQVDALRKASCEEIYEETASGAKAERPILDELISHVREGDVLIIWKLGRLGRSLKNLVDIINLLSQKKVGLQSLSDPVDTTTTHGRLIFSIFA